jgi:LacI family transcriptional regulator
MSVENGRESRRATLEDVARTAGVSLATADRALNGRPGVRAATRARIDAAVARLGYRVNQAAAQLARNRSFRFLFILPANANSFMASLEAHAREVATSLGPQAACIDISHVDIFDPAGLALALETIPPHYDGVAVVAVEHPRVRAAIDALSARGTHVVTLVSDAPASRRFHHVGIDNAAAGRTAGSLMGRFLGGITRGRIGVIAGSLSLRDHAERSFGFNQVINAEYGRFTVLPVLEGRDDPARNRVHAKALLADRSLVGIYNVGAGNEGIAEALAQSTRPQKVVWIAHELSTETRRLLCCNVADAVIDQNAGHEARSAARVLLARCTGSPIDFDQERIRIEIYLRDNLP